MTPQAKKKSVEVSPAAVVSMMLHAVKYTHEPVHGVLLGSFGGDKVKVTEAIPVCHGAPTHPLLETALALIDSINDDSSAAVVVGWYVSPRLMKDDRPGPAALKIVSSLASGDSAKEPALLVISNDDMAKVLRGEEQSLDTVVKALGKNFGKQWLEPMAISFDNEASASKAVQKAFQESLPVVDLVDHLEADPKTSKWYPNDSLNRFVKQHS